MTNEQPRIVQKLEAEKANRPRHFSAQERLVRSAAGLAVALTAMGIAIVVVVRQGEIPIALLALCFMSAIFASGIMDSRTLLDLVRIVFRREK